jgi:hypothetical protein
MRTVLVLWILLLLSPRTPAAQQVISFPDSSSGTSSGVLALAGLGGMAVGVLGGGLIGIGFDDDDGLDAADGAFVGAVAGSALAIPAAVHLANGSRGDLGQSILVSALVGGVLLGTGWAAESGELVLAAPIGQLISAVIIERNTSK